MAAMPMKLRDMWKTLNTLRQNTEDRGRIAIVGPVASGKRTLEATMTGTLMPGYILRQEIVPPADGGDLNEVAVAGAQLVRGLRPDAIVFCIGAGQLPTAADVTFITGVRSAGGHVVVVVTKADLVDIVEPTLLAACEAFKVSPEDVPVVSAVSGTNLDQLAIKIAKAAPRDRLLPLGSSFESLREPVARQIVGQVSTQNGVLATLGFAPGADIAALTANQIRMVLEIASLYGEEMTVARAREILATIGGGLILRGVARQLLGFIPVAGWAVKGGVAYAGTQALGRTAIAYFSNPQFRDEATRRLQEATSGLRDAVQPYADRVTRKNTGHGGV